MEFNRIAPSPVFQDFPPADAQEAVPAQETDTAVALAAAVTPAPTVIGYVPLLGTLAPAPAPAPVAKEAQKVQGPQLSVGETRPPAISPPQPASVPRITLVPSSAVMIPGQTVRIDVRIDGGQDVASVPFHVQHDGKVLQFERVQAGEFLGRDGAAPVVMAAPMEGKGEVVVGITKVGPGVGISGSGTLLVLEFRVVGAGTTLLGFAQQRVLNSRRREVPAQFISTQLAAN